MTHGSRPDRLGDQIREELGGLLTRSVRDPGIGFVTVTHVRVSADLGTARVYYTCLGSDADRQRTKKALERALPFLRRQLGSRLRLRRIPELHFTFDESIERHDRIERLLNELHITPDDDDPNEP